MRLKNQFVYQLILSKVTCRFNIILITSSEVFCRNRDDFITYLNIERIYSNQLFWKIKKTLRFFKCYFKALKSRLCEIHVKIDMYQ